MYNAVLGQGARAPNELAVEVTGRRAADQLEQRELDIETSEDVDTIEFGRKQGKEYRKDSFAAASPLHHPMHRKHNANHTPADLVARVSALLQDQDLPALDPAQKQDRHALSVLLSQLRRAHRERSERLTAQRTTRAATGTATVTDRHSTAVATTAADAAMASMPKLDSEHHIFKTLRDMIATEESRPDQQPSPVLGDADDSDFAPRSQPPTRASTATPAVRPATGLDVQRARRLASATRNRDVCAVQ